MYLRTLLYKAFLGKGFGVLEENNHQPAPTRAGALLHSSDCILVEEHDYSSPYQRVNWSTPYDPRVPKALNEFAFCRSNQVGWAELHKLMLRAEEEAVVLCGPYYTLDFILYTKWCSADRLPALYDILSIWQHHFLLACTFLSLNSRLLLSHTFHNNGTVVSHQDLWATKLVSWTVVRVFVQSRTSVRVMCEEQLLLKCSNTCAVWGFWSLSALHISLSLWICSAPLSETDKLQMCAAATCQKTRLAISCCQKNLCCCSEAAAQLCLPEPGMEVAMFARQTDRQGAIAGQWKGPI